MILQNKSRLLQPKPQLIFYTGKKESRWRGWLSVEVTKKGCLYQLKLKCKYIRRYT